MVTMRKAAAVAVGVLSVAACATGPVAPGGGGEPIVVGFAQADQLSSWRAANTESLRQAFSAQAGFDLIVATGVGDAATQREAVRSFIDQGVDAIVIAPVAAEGWDEVLMQALDAGIPVIIEDRTVTAAPELYAAWVGLDYAREGALAAEWIVEQYGEADTSVVVLEGSSGLAATRELTRGFAEVIKDTPVTVVSSLSGEPMRAEGRRLMEGLLDKHGLAGIDVVMAHSDEMGLGAIQAIEAAGGVPGVDIAVVTVGASRAGLQALGEGRISYIVECNPMLGDAVADALRAVLAGEPVDKAVYLRDRTFTQEQAAAAIGSRPY